MARSVTLSQLIERVRRMADMEVRGPVTDSEITDYLNDAATELYDELVSNYQEEWGVNPSPATLHVTASVATCALPDDCYKVRGVDRLVSGVSGSSSARWEKLELASFEDRNDWYGDAVDYYGNQAFGYRPLGRTSISFWPVPQENATLRLWFIPVLARMTSGSDTLDGINGFEELVVCDAAIKCLMKEESDVSELLRRKEQLRRRIAAMSDERVVGDTDVIRDVVGGWSLFGRYPFSRRGW